MSNACEWLTWILLGVGDLSINPPVVTLRGHPPPRLAKKQKPVKLIDTL
jgi:hypothetical protein